jgi:hypothetical protein
MNRVCEIAITAHFELCTVRTLLPPFPPSLCRCGVLLPPFCEKEVFLLPPSCPGGCCLFRNYSLALAFVRSSSPPSRTYRYRFTRNINPTDMAVAAFSTHNHRSSIETEKSQSAEKRGGGRVIPEGVVTSPSYRKDHLHVEEREKCDFARRAGPCIRSCSCR